MSVLKLVLTIFSSVLQAVLAAATKLAVRQTQRADVAQADANAALAALDKLQDALATSLNDVVRARADLHNKIEELDRRARGLGI